MFGILIAICITTVLLPMQWLNYGFSKIMANLWLPWLTIMTMVFICSKK